MFHHFHFEDNIPFGQGSITEYKFEKIISFLQEKYILLPASEWYEKSISNKIRNNEICLTFDDNLKGQFEVAFPILEKYRLSGFWFIYSSPLVGVIEKLELYRYFRCTFFNNINDFYIEFTFATEKLFGRSRLNKLLTKYNSNEYLKPFPFYSKEDKIFRFIRDEILGKEKYNLVMDRMIESSKLDVFNVGKKIWFGKDEISTLCNSGNIIGLHSHSHPTRLSNLNYEDQFDEYYTNKKILEDITEYKLKIAAHPTNSYNTDTFKVFKELGVEMAFRSNSENRFNSIFEMPRVDHALINI